MDEQYDVVVIGAGPAGLNAALVLARARRRVAVVDAGQPRNASAAHLHGFLSRDGMAPAALLAAGRAEVAGYGGRLIEGRVDRVDPGFVVHLADGAPLRTRRVLLATGLRDELPGIPGVRERWGRDVLHCPYCHGYEVRDQPIGVLATGPASVYHALLVRQWSADVVLFAHDVDVCGEERERLTACGIRIVDGEVGRLVVDGDRLRGVELADGLVVPRSAVFVGPRMVSNDSLLTSLGCERDQDGWVTTDAAGRTSVPGVWAVGNVADQRAQLITSAAAGAKAGIDINQDLLDEDIDEALRRRRGRSSVEAAAARRAS